MDPAKEKGYANFSFRNAYKVSQLLGSGAYGRVYKGTAPNGAEVALKEIIIEEKSEGIPLSTLRELSVLKKLQCHDSSYIVQMLDISLTKKEGHLHIYIVFEYIDCDLAYFLSHLAPSTGLDLDTIRDLSCQLLRGTEFLHSHRVIHRDLKPANILIDRQGKKLKITDFGLSRVLGWESTLTPIVVTLWYRAPEVLIQSEYLSPCDIWAAGCIIAELFNRTALFNAENELSVLCLIFDAIGFPEDCEWPSLSHLRRSDFKSGDTGPSIRSCIKTDDVDALSLIESMLQFNPKKRITATQALQLPYFRRRSISVQTDFPATYSLPLIQTLSRSSADHSAAQYTPCIAHRHSIIPIQSIYTQESLTNSRTHHEHRNSLIRNPVSRNRAPDLELHGSSDCQHSSPPGFFMPRTINRANQLKELQSFANHLNSCDIDEQNHDLMISVVKQVIDDDVSGSPSVVSSTETQPDSTEFGMPHRPVTRQQTRAAAAARRYTQPTSLLNIHNIVPTSDVSHTTRAQESCSTSVGHPVNYSQYGTNFEQESSHNLHMRQSGRQKKVARRRTVLGNIGINPSRGSLPWPSYSSSVYDSSEGSSGSPMCVGPFDAIAKDYSMVYDPDKHTHSTYSREPLAQPAQSICQTSSINCSSQPSLDHYVRLPRYSIGPSAVNCTLKPIGEFPAFSDHRQNISKLSVSDAHSVYRPNTELGYSTVSDLKENDAALCSPSKQARMHPIPSHSIAHFEAPNSFHRFTSEADSSMLDDDDLLIQEDDDDKEDGNDSVNTSMGINSAMTGLALVTRTHSLNKSFISQEEVADTTTVVDESETNVTETVHKTASSRPHVFNPKRLTMPSVFQRSSSIPKAN